MVSVSSKWVTWFRDSYLRADRASKKQKEIKIKDKAMAIDRDTMSEEKLSAKSMISSTAVIINDPREYQLELFDIAKKQNTIAVLDTGLLILWFYFIFLIRS